MASQLRILTANKSELLTYEPARSLSGLFPQVVIRDINDVVIDTVNLTESATLTGVYIGNTSIDVGSYTAVYIAYTDAGHTVESERAGRASEIWNVRSTDDTFGSAPRGNSSGGLFDDDLKAIAKVMKEVLGGKTPELKSVWDEELSNGKLAGDELMAKSEFNHKEDDVKTDISFDFSEVKDFIKSQIDILKINIPNHSHELSNITNLLNNIEPQDINRVFDAVEDLRNEISSSENIKSDGDLGKISNELKELSLTLDNNEKLIRKSDKLNLDRLQKVVKEIDKMFRVLSRQIATNNSLKNLNRIADKFSNIKDKIDEII